MTSDAHSIPLGLELNWRRRGLKNTYRSITIDYLADNGIGAAVHPVSGYCGLLIKLRVVGERSALSSCSRRVGILLCGVVP